VGKSAGTQIVGVTSPYVHTGRTNGTPYFYVVTAVNAGGESVESAQVGATPQVPAPGAPTGVTASAGDGQVTISWSAVTGATSYNLYWSTSTGVTKSNGTKIAGVTSPYTHTGRTNGTAYFYVVTAVNAAGESAESAQVSATPQAPAPGAPTLSLLTSGLKQLNFSWSASAGATYYQLQQDPNGTGAYAQVGADIAAPTTTAAVAIAVHRLNWAQARYRVRACNAGGCGDSAPVAIAPAMLAAIGYAKASNTGAGDVFGYAVALSGDGNNLAVGAYGEDSAATGMAATRPPTRPRTPARCTCSPGAAPSGASRPM
jgi:fibronectin type 3 domain-containing protein